MREVLLVLAGIEGKYIRTTLVREKQGGGGLLTIDVDSTDKSTASLVLQLLPICDSVREVRQFIRQHSKYE